MGFGSVRWKKLDVGNEWDVEATGATVVYILLWCLADNMMLEDMAQTHKVPHSCLDVEVGFYADPFAFDGIVFL